MRPDELAHLQAIERAAGEAFRAIGMDAIADDEPLSIDELEIYRASGRAWVLEGDDGTPAAYVLVDVLDGNAHVEQVSVHPMFRGLGYGARLVDHVAAWAAAQGMESVTLTTFTDVPWNAPYYERLGFVVLTEAEIGPELRARREEEAAHGLDPDTRVCMGRATA